MIRFSKLMPPTEEGGAPVEVDVRHLPRSAIAACPHFIWVADHYRHDGSCKCNDPKETVMKEWGYRWSKTKNQWD